MIRNAFLSLILLVMVRGAWAQDTLLMKVTPNFPRVGQEVTLGFDGAFLFNEIKANSSAEPKLIFPGVPKVSFTLPPQAFTFKTTFEAPGLYFFGPYHFAAGDQQVYVPKCEVMVGKAIPEESGFWLRFFQQNGTYYLVQDFQYYPSEDEPGVMNEGRPTPPTIIADKLEGVKLVRANSSSNMTFVDGQQHSSQIVVSRVVFEEGFTGEILLDASYFSALPAGWELIPVVIRPE